MISSIRPGDKVLIPIFGHLLAEIAERAGADVHCFEVLWGVFTREQIEQAIKKYNLNY